MPERPTWADVERKLSDREARFRTLFAEMLEDEDWLVGTSDSKGERILKHLRGNGLAPGYTPRLLPIARSAVDVGKHQIITGETPGITLELPEEAHRSEDKAAEHKEALEDKLRALSWYIDSHGHGLLNELTDHVLGLGMGVLAYPYVPHRMPKPVDEPTPSSKPEDRLAYAQYKRNQMQSFPFDVRVCAPGTVYFDPYHSEYEDVIEKQLVPAGAFAELLTEDERKGTNVPLVIYCSREWYGCWIGGRPLLTEADGATDGVAPNTTGVLWYKLGFSGFGTLTSGAEWHYRIKGLLRDGRDVIKGYILAYNQMENIRGLHSFAEVEIVGTPEGVADAKARSRFGPAGTWEHNAANTDLGVTMAYVNPPVVPQVLIAQMEEGKRQLEILFGPEILRGIYRDDTASGQRTRAAYAKAPYQQSKQAVQRDLWGAMLMDIQFMVKYVIDGAISIPSPSGGVVSLGADDIVDNAWTIVDLSPPTEEDKAFKLQDAEMKLKLGVISKRRAISDTSEGDLDADVVFAEQTAEAQAAEPAYGATVMQLAIQIAAQELGIDPMVLQGGQQGQAALPVPGQGGDPAAQPGPGGLTLPGEQPAPAALGSPDDVQQQGESYFGQLPRTA